MTWSLSSKPRRGALMAAVVAGGLFSALAAPVQAAPLGPAPGLAGETGITTVQYGWRGHHHHHGWGRRHHWVHHHHGGWGRHRGWGHHHHHGGWGRRHGWGHHHGHWH